LCTMPIKIERLRPRSGISEHPLEEKAGFKLADPAYGNEMHHAKHAIHVRTIEEAADLIERKACSIWMIRPGKRASLICPTSLRITRS
ncbi:MAG: hypothetical protein ACRYG8_05690, partial [Janthinobacterium lividum]